MISRLILKHKTASPKFPDLRRAEGFTLVEVMIAIVLLVMISVAIYQATTQTFRYRTKLINEGDFYGGVRLAMGLLDRDIAALFSPVNLNPKNFTTADPPTDERTGPPRPPNQAAMAQAQELTELQNSELGQTTDYWLGATDLTAIRPSRFVGTENRLQFVSASHMRVYKNTEESEFTKIVYEIRDEKDSDLGSDAKLLVRIVDANVFDNGLRKGKEAKIYPLLSGVKRMKYRYFRRDKRVWENTWDSNREDMKGLYPEIIELTVEVVGLSKLSFKGKYLFKPETPFYGLDPTF